MDFQHLPNFISSAKKPIVQNIELDLSIANLYRGDMYGLFRKHFEIDPELIQYNITLNGFNSSSDYNGETKILLVQDGVYRQYI